MSGVVLKAKSVGGARTRLAVYSAEALSMLAALLHLWVMPEHFEEWWGYGLFFLAAAAFQALYTMLMPRLAGRQSFLIAGVVGNLSIIALYLVTRTIGVPAGPHAGQLEEVGFIDVAATSAEALLVVILAALSFGLYRAYKNRHG